MFKKKTNYIQNSTASIILLRPVVIKNKDCSFKNKSSVKFIIQLDKINPISK